MPWLLKALLILLKSRRGRRLLFAVGVGVLELARGERARRLYGRARTYVAEQASRP
jgi:hypothetical protein